MKIIDISQEVFSCCVYPGDPAPQKQMLAGMDAGDEYNLSAFSMCAHNGTHIDAPAHFIRDGKTIGQMDMEAFVGPCYVARHEGKVAAEDARDILCRAQRQGAGERILIAGNATVTEEAARVFAQAKIRLIGNESQTVGPENAPMAVHRILLGADIALLEGVVLTHVEEGSYLLCAAPLNLGASEGAPCRAVLLEGYCS